MVGVFGEKVTLSQANGPDVSLIVRGTELYGTYEIPSTTNPPPDVERHATESDEVRVRKIDQRTRQLAQRAPAQPKEGGKT
jgi:hypothetical protein